MNSIRRSIAISTRVPLHHFLCNSRFKPVRNAKHSVLKKYFFCWNISFSVRSIVRTKMIKCFMICVGVYPEMPKGKPFISMVKGTLTPADELIVANCSGPTGRPAPHLTWTLAGQQVTRIRKSQITAASLYQSIPNAGVGAFCSESTTNCNGSLTDNY